MDEIKEVKNNDRYIDKDKVLLDLKTLEFKNILRSMKFEIQQLRRRSSSSSKERSKQPQDGNNTQEAHFDKDNLNDENNKTTISEYQIQVKFYEQKLKYYY